MELKGLFKKNTNKIIDDSKANVPDGLYTKCPVCSKMVLTEDVFLNNCICPECNHYNKIDARTRISMVVDKNTFEEWDEGIKESNPCQFEGYSEKIVSLKAKTGLDEAIVTGRGKIDGNDTVIGICDTRFLMGSMGEVVGEKLTRAVEKATELKLPVIVFTCSGGARMQEGIVSLMQMAKTSAAIKKHDEAGLLYITVLTDPTTGGVTASFAMLGDIILAEPGALVGFAGPRVIKQTIGQDLPKGFQRAEFLLEHGMIDAIVERHELKSTLGYLLKVHKQSDNYKMEDYKVYLSDKFETLKNEGNQELISISEYNKGLQSDENGISAWDRVQIARGADRPTALDYINRLTKNFYELHGDRQFGDDGAIVGGIAMFGKQPVTIIGQQKGRTTKENIHRNFGMPNPEGYRKALRLMKQAEKFNRPVICLVDTPGAYPGIGAEERGQGEAIARNLYEMSALKCPILSIVIGEGGSGGALALAVGDEVWMMENSIYSILSPEGFASILYKDARKAEEASEKMKITAKDLYDLGIIEKIIPENGEISKEKLRPIGLYMKIQIAKFLIEKCGMDSSELVEARYNRFRKIGG